MQIGHDLYIVRVVWLMGYLYHPSEECISRKSSWTGLASYAVVLAFFEPFWFRRAILSGLLMLDISSFCWTTACDCWVVLAADAGTRELLFPTFTFCGRRTHSNPTMPVSATLR